MNLKMGSRIIAATGIAALLFALAACNQGHNPPKGTQGQSTPASKDELGLKDKVSNSLTSAVTMLSAKKIMLDPATKQFTIQAASTATELSAKDIFKGSDYNDMTQEFTVTPANGSVTVASDKSKLTIGYAGKTEGDTYTVTLTFTNTKNKKVSTFNFTVINKKQQPPKDELNLKTKVEAALTAAVEELKKKDIKFDAADNKFVIAADSTATELSAKEIFKGNDYNGMTQEFTITPVSGSVTVASDKSKLAIKVASKTEGDSYAVKLTFTKDKKISEFKFTVINKKQNALKDELMLRDEVRKSLSGVVTKFNDKKILIDPIEKTFIIQPDSRENELDFNDIFKRDNQQYKDTERAVTVTPDRGSITGRVDTFSKEGRLEIQYAKNTEKGDTFTVMYTFTKSGKTSEFKFTFLNKKTKIFFRDQIQPRVKLLVQKLNGNQDDFWTNASKGKYQNGIVLPETGKIDDIDGITFKWGLKKGKEYGARIGKNKDGKLAVLIDKAQTGKDVTLTVTLTKPGHRDLTLDADPDGTDAIWAIYLRIEN